MMQDFDINNTLEIFKQTLNSRECIKKWADWFILHERILYKRSYAQPLLRYVMLEMGEEILEEVLEGVCSSHIGGMCTCDCYHAH